MRHETAVAAALGLTAVLVVTLGLAAYFARQSVRHGATSERWQEIAVAQDKALSGLLSQGLNSVAGSLQQPHSVWAEFVVPRALTGSAFIDNLRALGEQYVVDLHRVQQATALSTRRQVEAEARESAKAAVKSFATSMVSTATTVSDEISKALRQHHDPEVFGTLTKIDHGVQQMLHQAQSYVVLAGGVIGQRHPASTLTDVVGAAQGAISDYARINPYASDRWLVARMVGPVKLILSHLLDNAARYSPTESRVWVDAEHGHHGVTLLIDDAGKRMSDEELAHAQSILDGRQDVDILTMALHPRAGFPVIARLARRYGVRVVLSGSNRFGGMCASVFLPEKHFTPAPPEPEPAVQVTGLDTSTPATDEAETENGLPTRRRRPPMQRRQAPVERLASTEPARAALVGRWAEASRKARGEAALPQTAAPHPAAGTDQKGSLDS